MIEDFYCLELWKRVVRSFGGRFTRILSACLSRPDVADQFLNPQRDRLETTIHFRPAD